MILDMGCGNAIQRLACLAKPRGCLGWRLAGALGLMLVCQAVSAPSLLAIPSAALARLEWSSPFRIAPIFEGQGEGEALDAIACPSTGQCIALSRSGAEVTFDPTRPESARSTMLPGAGPSVALACPVSTQCTALRGIAEPTFEPFSAEVPRLLTIDEAADLEGLSCPSLTQCTAVDGSSGEVTFDPSSSGGAARVAILTGSDGGPSTESPAPRSNSALP